MLLRSQRILGADWLEDMENFKMPIWFWHSRDVLWRTLRILSLSVWMSRKLFFPQCISRYARTCRKIQFCMNFWTNCYSRMSVQNKYGVDKRRTPPTWSIVWLTGHTFALDPINSFIITYGYMWALILTAVLIYTFFGFSLLFGVSVTKCWWW